MNFKKFVSVNKKRIMGTSLLLSMIFAQTVGAASSVSGSIVSKGNIEYDADSDGKADVYFYSKDLSTLATGIDSLNVDISNMEVAMTQLSNTTTQYKTDIINGLNNSVYAKSNISSDATFEQIIEKINNIPAPTTATGSYYSGGDNSGLNAGLSSSNTSANVNIDGVTTLDLGIEEAITLPSGYYPNDITIRNNVANRGSLLFNPATPISQVLSAGYYSGGTLDSSAAFSAGEQAVINNPEVYGISSSAEIKYSGLQWGFQKNAGEGPQNSTTYYTFPLTITGVKELSVIVSFYNSMADSHRSSITFYNADNDAELLSLSTNTGEGSVSKSGVMDLTGVNTVKVKIWFWSWYAGPQSITLTDCTFKL